MLRRKPGAGQPVDEIDRELLEGVDAELPWRTLVHSASCSAQEAEQRLARLLRTGFLEGSLGADTVRPSLATRPTQPSLKPSEPASLPPSRNSAPPTAYSAGEALLRELRARRGGVSHPPPEHTRPAAAERKRESLGPTAYTRHEESQLLELIDELSLGQGMQRWAAARLREALEEERAAQYLQAVAILQVVMAQLDDPRVRVERDRVQAKLQKASSGVYRSHALAAERALKHKEAAEHWRKVLEAIPNDAEAALHAATCMMESGDLKQAGHYARRAAELAPQSVNAHRLLFQFFRKTGMMASANRQREILRRLMKA